MKHFFLELRAPKLAYDIRAGIGPVLLCVHCNSSHCGLWRPRLDHLPDYAALRLDLRGHGQSRWARPPAYSAVDYADDIRATGRTGAKATTAPMRFRGHRARPRA